MSGLLPRTPDDGGSIGGGGSGNFLSLTVGSLIVTGAASIASLAVSGAASFSTLAANVVSAMSILSDVYSNRTTNSTVTLSTTGGNANVLLSPHGTGLVVVTGGATDGAITVNHTANAGAIINKTGAASAANGYRCSQNGVYGAEFGYNSTTNEAYVSSNSGNVKLSPAGVTAHSTTSQGITFIPTTLALPRFELGPGNSNEIVLASSRTVGAYFTSAAVGDCVLRQANTANSIRIGVGSGIAQIVLANALTTTTNPLLMNSPTFHPITVNNTSATSGNDILFQNSGVNVVGFGVNQATNEAYSWVYANQPYKIGTNNAERLRIAAAGIANDNTLVNMLGLQGTTLSYKNNVADTSTAQVLTNKTLDSASNTLTITNAPLAAANVNTLIDQALLMSSSPTFSVVTAVGVDWGTTSRTFSAAGNVAAGATISLFSSAIPASAAWTLEFHGSVRGDAGEGFGEYRYSYRVYNNAGALVSGNGVSQDKSEVDVGGGFVGNVAFSLTTGGANASLNIVSTLAGPLSFGGLVTIYKA